VAPVGVVRPTDPGTGSCGEGAVPLWRSTAARSRIGADSHKVKHVGIRRCGLAAAGAALATAVFAGWIGLGAGGPATTRWFDCVLTACAAGVACVACARAAVADAGRRRMFWALLGCATAAWTAGELTWGYESVIRGDAVVPFPSWADVPFLAAIPLTVAALAVHPATTASLTRKTRWLFDGLVVATALLFLSWTLVLGPTWAASDLGTWAGVVSLAYPFGDVVIVFFVLLAIRGMGPGDRRSLSWLLAALLVMSLADSTSFSYVAAADYTSPGLIDTGWFAAYLGIALAAYNARAVPAVSRPLPAGPSLASLVAPIALVLVTLTVAALEIRVGHALDRASRVIAVVLIALVLARQVLALFEVLAPSRDSSDTRADRLERVMLGGR